ncbi:DEAD/DEAH box helicase, partial [Candidatus Micrarchaeota archaeon]|nr:DEAD/DEAH box helicase [Candidatus Micrarchaeota archaeon]
KDAIPRILNGENVLVVAPTGYGKTEAALLPVLEKIYKKEKGINALYITPLRALNRDLLERFKWWCEKLEVTYGIRHGDTTQSERAKQSKNPPQIMLTTVEMLQALLIAKSFKKHLENVEFVIMDEVHDIVDNKRGAQLSLSLERLAEIADFQRISLSATISEIDETAKMFLGKNYSVSKLNEKRETEIEVEYIEGPVKRINRIEKILEKEKCLVFVNTRSTAEELGASLSERIKTLTVHHGSLSKEIRVDAEKNFKEGNLSGLVSTSSLELGIDIGDIEKVIQYSSPRTVSRLLQRVGRAGHGINKISKGVIIAPDFDDYLESEVIATLAKNGWIEPKGTERGCLDVIAQQMTGLAFQGRVSLKDIHRILGRSYAYNIDYHTLMLIAIQLYSEGILFFDQKNGEETIKLKRRGYEYYYSNLSTIPKTKRYTVKNIQTNRIISILDERFVSHLEIGASFLSKGKPWTVVDIEKEDILAEPAYSMDVLVPAWVGEDIPVPYEVARQTGKLRKIKKDVEPLPDDEKILVEIIEDVIVVHGCFGTKVNETLGRVISYKLSKIIGESVNTVSDPYRIIIKTPYPLKTEIIKRAFEIGDIKGPLEKSLQNSYLIKLKFTQVGRSFGLLDDNAQIGHRFIEALKNSVVYRETLRETYFRYFDIEKTGEIIDDVLSGKIKLVFDKRKKPSYFAEMGIKKFSGGETFGTFQPREKMIENFKEFHLKKVIELECINCGASRFLYLGGSGEEIKCHKCGEKSFTLKKLKSKNEREHAAGLIRNYGRKALVALSIYGIGPSTADRILKKLHKDEEAFYLELIESQKNFIKNKKYWKME